MNNYSYVNHSTFQQLLTLILLIQGIYFSYALLKFSWIKSLSERNNYFIFYFFNFELSKKNNLKYRIDKDRIIHPRIIKLSVRMCLMLNAWVLAFKELNNVQTTVILQVFVLKYESARFQNNNIKEFFIIYFWGFRFHNNV